MLNKSNGEKSKMAASYFCILPSDWPKWIYSSIQVQLYVPDSLQNLDNWHVYGGFQPCIEVTNKPLLGLTKSEHPD